jgi:hypothetical protein
VSTYDVRVWGILRNKTAKGATAGQTTVISVDQLIYQGASPRSGRPIHASSPTSADWKGLSIDEREYSTNPVYMTASEDDLPGDVAVRAAEVAAGTLPVAGGVAIGAAAALGGPPGAILALLVGGAVSSGLAGALAGYLGRRQRSRIAAKFDEEALQLSSIINDISEEDATSERREMEEHLTMQGLREEIDRLINMHHLEIKSLQRASTKTAWWTFVMGTLLGFAGNILASLVMS